MHVLRFEMHVNSILLFEIENNTSRLKKNSLMLQRLKSLIKLGRADTTLLSVIIHFKQRCIDPNKVSFITPVMLLIKLRTKGSHLIHYCFVLGGKLFRDYIIICIIDILVFLKNLANRCTFKLSLFIIRVSKMGQNKF